MMTIWSSGYLEGLIRKWLRLFLGEKIRDSYEDGIPLGPLFTGLCLVVINISVGEMGLS